MDLSRANLSAISNLNQRQRAAYSVANMQNNPYIMKTPDGEQDISWLL